jgi:phenylacetyl-CoA:acceptor oxidoreductase subunit 2
MTAGVRPSRQTSWDARAAANFVCGGAGAGLIVSAALAGQRGHALALLLVAGLALVGTGLLCVWHELGRPLRALHVFFHPRTSWMSREAFVATLLMPAGLAAAVADVAMLTWLAAVLALAFVGCQALMLQGARGIPAWREPLTAPLLVTTALVEGCGWLLARAPWLPTASPAVLAAFGALVLLRLLVWLAYRRAVALSSAPALAALGRTGRALQLGGTLLPLALIAWIATGALGGTAALALCAVAGVAAAASGAHLKYTLVVHAGFTQGPALARLPVRGARRPHGS